MFRSVIFTKNRVISKLQVKYFINLLCKRCPVTAVVFKFSYVVLIFMAKILLSTLSKENAVTIFFFHVIFQCSKIFFASSWMLSIILRALQSSLTNSWWRSQSLKPVHWFCRANQLTAFYIIRTSYMKELRKLRSNGLGKRDFTGAFFRYFCN